MLQITDENFEAEVLKSEIPVLVDFFAEWCGPCKIMGPVFEEIGAKYEGKIKFVELNVDEAPETAAKYGVMSIPTIISFVGGKIINTIIGLQDEDSIVKEAEGLLK